MSSKPFAWYSLAFCGVLIAATFGCQPTDDDGAPAESVVNQTPEKPQRLKVLSIDDPQQVAARIAQVWTAQTAGEIEVTYTTSEGLFAEAQPIPEFDIAIYPSVNMGELLARHAIQPLDLAQLKDLCADRRVLLRHDRTTVVQSGKSIFGASLGSPMLTLLYRKDVFEKLQLDVPQTWQEYRATVESLPSSAAKWTSEHGETIPTQICEPTTGTWLAEYLLARAAGSLVRQGRLSSYFEIDSLKPLINTPPFVDALEQMTAEREFKSDRPMTPEDCYIAIVRGEAALAVTWPSSHSIVEGASETFPIAVASIPGAYRSFDYREQKWKSISPDEIRATPLIPVSGRVASVSSKTRRLRTALRFEAWLMTADANREFSSQFPDLLFTQNSQLTDPFRWVNDQLPREAAQQMADVLRMYHDQSMVMSNMRIPGRAAYMKILADAARSAIGGHVTPQAALDSAAARWDELSEKLGRDQQRKLFQDSVRLDM